MRCNQRLARGGPGKLTHNEVGWDEGDAEFPIFCNPGDLLAPLNLPTRHVGDIQAIPAADGGQRAYMGPQLYPMYKDEHFPFMFYFFFPCACIDSSWESCVARFLLASSAGTAFTGLGSGGPSPEGEGGGSSVCVALGFLWCGNFRCHWVGGNLMSETWLWVC